MNSLKLLIISTLNFLQSNEEGANFRLFLSLFIKEHSNLIKNFKLLEQILINMKNKGDLTKILNEQLYEIINVNKQNKKYIEIYLIYLILTQKTETVNALLKDGDINEQSIIESIEKYQKIFSNSVKLFPKYTFLIKFANSFNKIESILRCSKDLADFIYFLNEEKDFIIKYIDEKNYLRIENFLREAFFQKYDEDFYLAIYSLRQLEIKFNKKFFGLPLKLLPSLYEKGNLSSTILTWIIDDEHQYFNINIFLSNLAQVKITNNLVNFEIIEIIEILTNKKVKNLDLIALLFKSIKFENLNEKIKPIFSKIIKNDLDYFLSEPNLIFNLIKEIIEKVNILKKIDTFEYVFICIDKFIEKEKDFNIKDEMKKLINIMSKKFLTILGEIKNEKISNEKEFFEITSEFIYLNYKYNEKNEFLLNDNIQFELLNDIYSHFFNKYEVSDIYFDELISDIIKKRKLGKIYNILMEKKYVSKFKNLLNKFVIKYDELFEENHFNFFLLEYLYKNKFFETSNNFFYTNKIKEKLNTLGNNINNINNISLKQMEFLLNDKQKIFFFSMIDKDDYFKTNIVADLEKNILLIKSMINIEHSDEFLLLNNYQKIKFSGQDAIIDSIKKFVKDLEDDKISGINGLKKKYDKIKFVLSLVKNLVKDMPSNYFFKIIQEKNMDYSLFEKILIIFDEKKDEEMNTDLICLFNEFVKLNSEEKEKIVIVLSECAKLLDTIYLNSDFENVKIFSNDDNDNNYKIGINEIDKRIMLLIAKYKIKEIYNDYKLFKEKILKCLHKKKFRKKKLIITIITIKQNLIRFYFFWE